MTVVWPVYDGIGRKVGSDRSVNRFFRLFDIYCRLEEMKLDNYVTRRRRYVTK
jgi:hypothetical protein